MDITYKILGSDGKEYGPVNQTQLQAWIHEGRVLGDSQVARSDDGSWRQAAQFTELVWPAAPASTPAPSAAPVTATGASEVVAALERQMRGGGSWFFWIAGLSVVNSIAAFSGSDWGFVIGLTLTQILDRVIGVLVVSVVIDVMLLGMFALFGVFAHKGHLWAFLVGMVLYALDALLPLLIQDWIGLIFHAIALWGLFSGFKAALALRRLRHG